MGWLNFGRKAMMKKTDEQIVSINNFQGFTAEEVEFLKMAFDSFFRKYKNCQSEEKAINFAKLCLSVHYKLNLKIKFEKIDNEFNLIRTAIGIQDIKDWLQMNDKARIILKTSGQENIFASLYNLKFFWNDSNYDFEFVSSKVNDLNIWLKFINFSLENSSYEENNILVGPRANPFGACLTLMISLTLGLPIKRFTLDEVDAFCNLINIDFEAWKTDVTNKFVKSINIENKLSIVNHSDYQLLLKYLSFDYNRCVMSVGGKINFEPKESLKFSSLQKLFESSVNCVTGKTQSSKIESAVAPLIRYHPVELYRLLKNKPILAKWLDEHLLKYVFIYSLMLDKEFADLIDLFIDHEFTTQIKEDLQKQVPLKELIGPMWAIEKPNKILESVMPINDGWNLFKRKEGITDRYIESKAEKLFEIFLLSCSPEQNLEILEKYGVNGKYFSYDAVPEKILISVAMTCEIKNDKLKSVINKNVLFKYINNDFTRKLFIKKTTLVSN